MVSGGTVSEQRKKVAEVATTLFGKHFDDTQVVIETLDVSLDHGQDLPSKAALSKAICAGIQINADLAALRRHPIPLWLEAEAAVEQRGDTLVRRTPESVRALADRLSKASDEPIDACIKTLTDTLLWISTVNEAIQRRDDRNTGDAVIGVDASADLTKQCANRQFGDHAMANTRSVTKIELSVRQFGYHAQ